MAAEPVEKPAVILPPEQFGSRVGLCRFHEAAAVSLQVRDGVQDLVPLGTWAPSDQLGERT